MNAYEEYFTIIKIYNLSETYSIYLPSQITLVLTFFDNNIMYPAFFLHYDTSISFHYCKLFFLIIFNSVNRTILRKYLVPYHVN